MKPLYCRFLLKFLNAKCCWILYGLVDEGFWILETLCYLKTLKIFLSLLILRQPNNLNKCLSFVESLTEILSRTF